MNIFFCFIAILAIGSLGAVSLDCISIVNVVMAVAITPPVGFSIAGSIHTGQFVGANKPEEAINSVKVYFTVGSKSSTLNIKECLLFNFLICLVLQAIFNAMLMASTAHYLPYVFTNDP